MGATLFGTTDEYDAHLVGNRIALTPKGAKLTSTSWEAFWHYETPEQAAAAAEQWNLAEDRDPPRDGLRMAADSRPPWDPAEALARLERT